MTWEQNFVNVWNMAFSPDGGTLAAEVRLNLYEYTIAVNGTAWNKTYNCVWEPIFNPNTGGVVAPVLHSKVTSSPALSTSTVPTSSAHN